MYTNFWLNKIDLSKKMKLSGKTIRFSCFLRENYEVLTLSEENLFGSHTIRGKPMRFLRFLREIYEVLTLSEGKL